MQSHQTKFPGFTLIELLVVIAIIGLLSTLAIVALGTARQKSRDARRVADLKQIQTAFEMYYNDSGTYPVTSSILLGDTDHYCLTSAGFQSAGSCGGQYINFPKDPAGGYYAYTGIANNYQVSADLEGNVNDLSGPISVTPNTSVAMNQVALSIPFNTPGCHPSGSVMGTLGEIVSTNRASTATYVDASGVVRTCGVNELRVTLSGALIEPAATNLAPRSQEFENSAWNKSSVAVNANTSAAPDGTMTADAVIENNSTGGHHVNANLVSAGAQQTLSIYFKAGARPWALVELTTSNYCYVNLSNLTSAPSAGTTCTVIDAGNGWRRISVSATPSSGGSLYISGATGNGGWSYAGDGVTPGFYIWGAQLETGPYATSYIPTAGGTATRNADVVSVSTPSDLSPSGFCMGGTVSTKFGVTSSYYHAVAVIRNPSSPPNFAGLYAMGNTSPSRIYAWTYDNNGSDQYGYSNQGYAAGSSHRLFGCFASGNYSLFADGTQQTVTVAGPGTGTLTTLFPTTYLGSNNGGENLAGTLKDFRVCKTGTFGQGGCR